MTLRDLSIAEQELVRQCVAAVADGPFIDDQEFATRVGLPRATIRALLHNWSNVDDSLDDSDACLALNNCLNEMCHGIEITPTEWAARVTVPRDQIKDVYRRWAQSRGWSTTGIR
jgi:hypothetical protein